VTPSVRSRKLAMFHGCCSGVAVLLVWGLVAYSQSPQSPLAPPTISVKSSLVVLPVRITDGNGDFVSGLSQDNFRVYDDGRLQQISLFQREDTPVAVGLVVDHSGSMGPKIAEVATAILSFAQLSNPQDEMFVVDFNDHVSLELPGGKPFSHNPSELAKAVSAISVRGQTALYDAVSEGIDHLRLAHGDKKALIIVSDGGDNASRHKYADVLALARQSQTVVYAIGLVGDTHEEEDPTVLQRLCNDTGGIAFFPKAGKSVIEVSSRIARDLREQYTLGFAPGTSDNRRLFRKIAVKVTAPGRGKLRVQTRRGYIDSQPPPAPGKRAS
jgi:Ca-activated chloride channel family protein